MTTTSYGPVSWDPVVTNDTDVATDTESGTNFMDIIQQCIAASGIFTNLIVIIVFLNDKKLRKKVPNICIINQVSTNIAPLPNPWIPF